jgi:hypothetical protein
VSEESIALTGRLDQNNCQIRSECLRELNLKSFAQGESNIAIITPARRKCNGFPGALCRSLRDSVAGSGGMGMKCKKMFEPKTTNIRPSRTRAMMVAIFMAR